MISRKLKRLKRLGIAFASFASLVGISVAAAPSAFANTTVTVQPGDSLWKIAHLHHTSVRALESANPTVNAANLTVGTVLQLPNQYTVKSGDSLWKIAHNYGISVTQLESANPGISTSNLTIGRVLTIPSGSGSAVRNTAQVQSSSQTGGYSSNVLYWMEHIIHAEAGGQPLNAKIAVGDVIMHRVASSQYPNTVQGVIFQVSSGHYQFTPVMNGYIYSTPTPTDKQAALAVLQSHEDIVPGAFVFYTPSKTPASSWVRQQPVIGSYGQLTFAK